LAERPSKVAEPFVQLLSDKAICPVDKALKLIADKMRIGYLGIERYDIDMELARSFSRDLCLRWCVLPFDRMSKSVLVATANPFNLTAQQELQKSCNLRILWYLAPPMELMKAIKKVYR
jgi:type IV pilus assembly protein PilB